MIKSANKTNLIPDDEIAFVQARASERITEILDSLGMEYLESSYYIHAHCPVHGGDNPRGFYWSMRTGTWKCATRQCEQDDCTGGSNSIFGLVRGALNRKLNKTITFVESIAIVKKILGLSENLPSNITIRTELDEFIEKKRRNKAQNSGNSKKNTPLWQVKHMLPPDTTYYPNRGVSEEIIHRYHISYCDNPSKPFYKRSFFPVLDFDGKNVIGWSARSIYEKCEQCQLYHNTAIPCPDKRKKAVYGKWKHSFNFKKEKSLYNIWYAKHFISQIYEAIIVEGPCDVWALEQAGIKNSVAIMGLSISSGQRLLLQKSGALTLKIALDNDDAGIKAAEKIEKDLNSYFRINIIKIPKEKKDFGNMNKQEIMGVFGVS